MKIQNLAVIFIIIVLPISILLAEYTKSKVNTLSLQSTYDSKLNDATYDALKAYQLNSINSDTSDYANSKMRDIKAAANTFFNSIATNFSLRGYDKNTLQNYVPALVFTMYDGYYIYSPYTNTWDEQTKNQQANQTSYKNNEKLYGLKPYIYYSCRYKDGSSNDIVITYTLDNYITIEGIINGESISKSGYLLTDVGHNGTNYTYKGQVIGSESRMKEKIAVDGEISEYEYIKTNGTKYYYDASKNEVFIILNNKKVKQDIPLPSQDTSAIGYYKDAYDMKNFITNNVFLSNLKVNDAVNEQGRKYIDLEDNPYTMPNAKIFDFGNDKNPIESESSNFNAHRIDVIKHSIERNLSIVISNYNSYSGSTTDFQMPKLKQTDWDKIMDNMSIITFMQGLNIGGKIYNGYSVVTNTKNKEVVTEDSIYIKTSDGQVHTRFCEDLRTISSGMSAFSKVDLERKTAEGEKGSIYYIPKYGILSYNCLVNANTQINTNWEENEYLKRIYYTALGRERYGQYRTTLIK